MCVGYDGCLGWRFSSQGVILIRRLFTAGPLLGLRTLIWLVLAVLLMSVAPHVAAVRRLRSLLVLTVVPLRVLVAWPIATVQTVRMRLTSYHHLLEENARLRAQRLLLRAQVHQQLAALREKTGLQALLRSSTNIKASQFLIAQLLAVDLNSFVQQVILNRGSQAGVYQGQPVLDAYGVMGQVMRVGYGTSRVLLLTDSHSAIPVQVWRNGYRAIAVGRGESADLQVLQVPDTADIRVGDALVSSGLGGRYPVGYPVGIVDQVLHRPGRHFALIRVHPSAHLHRSRQVLLVWPYRPHREGI